MTATATRCACGYVNEDAREPAAGSENLMNKAERLYENYLSTRVMRARKAVIDLRARRLRDPRDESLLRQLRTAEKELRAVEMQLMAQNARANDEPQAGDMTTEPVETAPEHEGPTPEPSAEPTTRFRANQATRAAAVPGTKRKDKFATDQAERAEQAVASTEPSLKVCPECEATLSPSAPQCICGYNFRLARRQPAFLTHEEIRALRGQ